MNVKTLAVAVLLLLASHADAQTNYYGQTKQAVTFGGVAQPITGSVGIYNVAGSSVVILTGAKQHPVLPFLAGVLAGHLYWPQEPAT